MRFGSACDDVVFLASDTRWLAVRGESTKMIPSLCMCLIAEFLLLITRAFSLFCERLSWGTVVPTGLFLVRTQTPSPGLQRWAFDW